MSTFTRYVLLEAPGWVVAALVAVALHRWLDVSAAAGAFLVAVWIGKDLVLYPWLRDAYAGEDRSPKEKLVGLEGVVTEPLEPTGVVRVGAELWRAERASRGGTIARGARVRVRGVRGLTLLVAHHDEPSPPHPEEEARDPISDG